MKNVLKDKAKEYGCKCAKGCIAELEKNTKKFATSIVEEIFKKSFPFAR